MKRLFALFIAAALLLCTAACAPNGPEMFSKALSLTDFGESLSGLSAYSVGTGVFADYTNVHANPTAIADMPLDITATSKKISESSKGLSLFIKEATEKYGFKNDFSISDYSKASTVEDALELLYAVTGTTNGLDRAKEAAASISSELKPLLAKYLSAAAAAYEAYYKNASRVSDSIYKTLQSYTYCPSATSNPAPMSNAYSASKLVTEARMLAAGKLLAEASSELAAALTKVSKLTTDGSSLTIVTPAGKIILGSNENDSYSSPEAFLLIDIAGNDTYSGSVAASISKTKPVSVVIDVAGDDVYDSTEENVPSQGAGILGAGILYDMAGNDQYNAKRASQGFALVGTGILFDANGDDKYRAEVSAQSCAYYGISVLADMRGNDKYYAYGYAQATAGNRAMAFLVDKTGNDTYYVEPLVQNGYSGMVYDLFPGVSGNWSQGCGAGNRSVSTNGNGLAGGIAGLIDLGGDDVYTGAIWVQGVGYWSGYGFLSDINGNDKYNSKYYSHSSVAHFGAAALIDIGGDDKHLVQYGGTSAGEGASHSFVYDRGVAILVDDGGNDIYDAIRYSFATSWSDYDSKGYEHQDMSYAFFIDAKGNDTYPCMSSMSFGWGRGGFFFDLDGEDTYKDSFFENDLSKTNTAGIFTDVENGSVSFWTEARKKFRI